MTALRHVWCRLTRRLSDPDVVEARRVIDETHRTTSRVSRTLIDLDAQGWGRRERPIEDDQFGRRREA